jgi:GNAT superfamily N-acetyltransferase
MHSNNLHKLDNPVWYALTEIHQPFAIGSDKLKRYQKTISPFLAFNEKANDVFEELDELIVKDEIFFIINELPQLPPNYIIEKKIICPQMIYHEPAGISLPDIPVRALNEQDDDKILALINEVFPGFYVRGTRLMGDYYGIFDNERLVSISGERLKMDGLTEISAVVTHPVYAGRKYAQKLVMHLVNKNREAGIIPFLHTEDTNQRAIRMYEHLGFITRKNIDVWKIKRTV